MCKLSMSITKPKIHSKLEMQQLKTTKKDRYKKKERNGTSKGQILEEDKKIKDKEIERIISRIFQPGKSEEW